MRDELNLNLIVSMERSQGFQRHKPYQKNGKNPVMKGEKELPFQLNIGKMVAEGWRNRNGGGGEGQYFISYRVR